MSFSTKISFVPRDCDVMSVSIDNIDIGLIPHGRSIVEIEELLNLKFKSLNFRKIYSNNFYDFVSVLTIEEFHNFYENEVNKNLINNLNLQIIEFTKNGKIRYNWVIIEVNENDINED